MSEALQREGGEIAERVLAFAHSSLFERTFAEGMGLVEETAGYLDGPGRKESTGLPRFAALAYAGESMRLTTRLMQVASWLLVQRAVRQGEMPVETALDPKYRISKALDDTPILEVTELPERLRDLLASSAVLHQRVSHLDARVYSGAGDVPEDNPVGAHLQRLRSAFEA